MKEPSLLEPRFGPRAPLRPLSRTQLVLKRHWRNTWGTSLLCKQTRRAFGVRYDWSWRQGCWNWRSHHGHLFLVKCTEITIVSPMWPRIQIVFFFFFFFLAMRLRLKSKWCRIVPHVFIGVAAVYRIGGPRSYLTWDHERDAENPFPPSDYARRFTFEPPCKDRGRMGKGKQGEASITSPPLLTAHDAVTKRVVEVRFPFQSQRITQVTWTPWSQVRV